MSSMLLTYLKCTACYRNNKQIPDSQPVQARLDELVKENALLRDAFAEVVSLGFGRVA